ncbi:hypothetical protein WG66_003045, partial [Moniliophthora roreri]
PAVKTLDPFSPQPSTAARFRQKWIIDDLRFRDLVVDQSCRRQPMRWEA